MAEHVQAALDQMVAPLRDLMDRKIFSESEVRSIVERRRESEYLLRRPAARKADFLRYIEQEIALERLRGLRTLKQKRDHRKSQPTEDDRLVEKDDKGRKEVQHIGDTHIVKLIHLLFVRAIRKSRSDLSLHLQHAEFCRQQKSWRRLGKVYAEALQVFPLQAGLWIEAASHEFFGPPRSIQNARILLQRGLRFNGKSEELWLAYFLLEMHFAQTIKGRRHILNPEADESLDFSAGSNAIGTEYKIPFVVLKNAIKALPDSVQFRLKFMDTCKQFPQTDALMEYVQRSIGNDFSSMPEAWIARAICQANRQHGEFTANETENDNGSQGDADKISQGPPKKLRADIHNPVLEVLRDSIAKLKTDDMLLQAIHFAVNYQNELSHRGSDGVTMKSEVRRFLDETWSLAKGSKNCDLVMEHTSHLVNSGEQDQALEIIKDFCLSNKTVPAKAWLLWASLAPPLELSRIFKLALQKITVDSPDYMLVLLRHFALQIETKEEKSKLFDSLQQILLLSPNTASAVQLPDAHQESGIQSVYDAALSYLTHALENYGIQEARKVYSAVLYQSTVKLSDDNADGIQKFVDACLEMEQGLSKKDRKPLCRLYNKAVEIFAGTSIEEVYRNGRNEEAIYGE